MADTRRIFGWLAVGAALGLALVLALLLLRDGEHEPQPGGPVVSRAAEPRTAEKPVISVPEPERRAPAPPPPVEAPRTGSVTGRLVDSQHLPLPRGQVEALQGDTGGMSGLTDLVALGRRTVADDGGRFTLGDIPAMSNLMLRVAGESLPLSEVGPYLVEAGGTTDLGDLVMEPGIAITGTVIDERGAPIAGARIGLIQGRSADPGEPYDEDTLPEPVRIVLSSESGRFRIEHAACESFVLAVSAESFANGLFPGGPEPGDRPGEIDVPVLLRPAGTLRGRVLDQADDRPLPGARVFAEPMDQGSGRSQAVTAADGSFVLDDVVPGNYALSATLKGYSRAHERSFDETPGAEIVFRLEKQGSLSGHVVGSDGEAIRAFDLQPRYRRRRLDPPIAQGAFQRVAAADGSFLVEDLDPGFWSVDVWAKGYSLTSSEPVRVKQGQPATGLTVTLLRGSTLSGLVRDDTGQPVKGASVSLHANREPEIDFLRDVEPMPGVTHGTRTDAEGRFRLEDLSARAYQVQVDHPEYAILRRNDVALAAEQALEAEPFILQRAATVRGSAVGGAGEPLPGVTVSLTEVNGYARQTTSDGRGQFVFTRVREGDYQLVCYGRQISLSAMLASVRNPPETFRVAAGATVQRNAVSLE
jgi:protocatechuate 3,4-dioxygenase beta subunit